MKRGNFDFVFAFLSFVLGAVLLAVLTGCTVPKGNIQSITQTVIGIDVAQSPDSQTPHVRLGFIRSQHHLVPTSKDEIHAPKVANSISVNQKFGSTEIDEDFSTGDVGAQGETTAKTSAKAKAEKKVVK